MAQSIIRQNYHAESEALLNKQINMELYASYVYLSMVIIPGYKVSI
jgi:ferritin heavy chain